MNYFSTKMLIILLTVTYYDFRNNLSFSLESFHILNQNNFNP